MIAIYLHVPSHFPEAKSMEKDMLAFARSAKDKVMWYKDVGDDNAERPELDRLMADVREGKVKKLAVWRLDQIENSGPGVVKLLDELRALGVGFVSVKEGLDL